MSWNRVARRRSSAKVVPGGADDEHLAGKAAVAAASAKLHAAIARGKARADSDSSSSGTGKDGSPGNTPRPQRGRRARAKARPAAALETHAELSSSELGGSELRAKVAVSGGTRTYHTTASNNGAAPRVVSLCAAPGAAEIDRADSSDWSDYALFTETRAAFAAQHASDATPLLREPSAGPATTYDDYMASRKNPGHVKKKESTCCPCCCKGRSESDSDPDDVAAEFSGLQSKYGKASWRPNSGTLV